MDALDNFRKGRSDREKSSYRNKQNSEERQLDLKHLYAHYLDRLQKQDRRNRSVFLPRVI